MVFLRFEKGHASGYARILWYLAAIAVPRETTKLLWLPVRIRTGLVDALECAYPTVEALGFV